MPAHLVRQMAGGVITTERTCVGDSSLIHVHALNNVVQDGIGQALGSHINVQSLPHSLTLDTQSGLAAAANCISPAAMHGKLIIQSELFVVAISVHIV